VPTLETPMSPGGSQASAGEGLSPCNIGILVLVLEMHPVTAASISHRAQLEAVMSKCTLSYQYNAAMLWWPSCFDVANGVDCSCTPTPWTTELVGSLVYATVTSMHHLHIVVSGGCWDGPQKLMPFVSHMFQDILTSACGVVSKATVSHPY